MRIGCPASRASCASDGGGYEEDDEAQSRPHNNIILEPITTVLERMILQTRDENQGEKTAARGLLARVVRYPLLAGTPPERLHSVGMRSNCHKVTEKHRSVEIR